MGSTVTPRVVACKLFAPVPVSRCATPIEKAGLGQHQRASADGTKSPAVRTAVLEPFQKDPVVSDFRNTVVPGDKKRVDGTAILAVCLIRANRKTEMTLNIAIGSRRDDTDLVCWPVAPEAVGIAKHLERTEDIERPHRRHCDDENTAYTPPR